LLIESRAASSTLLQEQLAQIMASLRDFPVEKQVDFTEDPVENIFLKWSFGFKTKKYGIDMIKRIKQRFKVIDYIIKIYIEGF
ncbi:MAG: hypothetical protein Q8769_01700, partial [Candidatus Phytoplasma australasiaticum]|nr:hypothetical protein [Candidatus Phytoplasma australasiaticum]